MAQDNTLMYVALGLGAFLLWKHSQASAAAPLVTTTDLAVTTDPAGVAAPVVALPDQPAQPFGPGSIYRRPVKPRRGMMRLEKNVPEVIDYYTPADQVLM